MVTVLGMTFKENVPDIRNSRVIDVVRELQSFGVKVQIADPLADPRAVDEEYGVALCDIEALEPADALTLAVAHDAYVEGGWRLVQQLLRDGAGLVFDLKMKLDRGTKPSGIELRRL